MRGLSVRPDTPQGLERIPVPERVVRRARVVGVLALCAGLLLAGCVGGGPIPETNETNTSEESGATWAPGPSWDPFYDTQSTNDSAWDWPDTVNGHQDDTEAGDGSTGTDTSDAGGSGSTDQSSSDDGGPDTTGSDSDDGTETEDADSDDGTEDSDVEDSDDTSSLVDDTNDTVTSTTENTTGTLDSTTENDSTLDTNLSG